MPAKKRKQSKEGAHKKLKAKANIFISERDMQSASIYFITERTAGGDGNGYEMGRGFGRRQRTRVRVEMGIGGTSKAPPLHFTSVRFVFENGEWRVRAEARAFSGANACGT